MTELLEGKAAIIYGGGGGIRSGVARTFAAGGARVFLVGRPREKPDLVAKDFTSSGGLAEVAVVDALDQRAVDEHVRTVASEAGSVDVSFVTARAAARQMIEQGSGVILHVNSASGAGAMPGMGSTGRADAATRRVPALDRAAGMTGTMPTCPAGSCSGDMTRSDHTKEVAPWISSSSSCWFPSPTWTGPRPSTPRRPASTWTSTTGPATTFASCS